MRITRRQSDSAETNELLSIASGVSQFDESLTRQEFKDEADLNFLLQRYGILPPSLRQPVYGDFNTDMDLVRAYETVREAETVFNGLPPQMRQAFGSWGNLAEAIANGEYDFAAEVEKYRPNPAEPASAPKGSEAGAADPAGATSPSAETPKA